MGYSSEQKGVAKAIARQGRKYGANRTEMLAAYSAALTEASLRNPRSASDHDSLGAFQQRPSQGWGSPSQVTNPDYAASKFFQAAKGLRGQKLYPGQLAQAVQKSAFPARYAQHTQEAAGLIKQFAGGTGAPAPVRAPGRATTSTQVVTPGVDRSGDRQALMMNYLQSRGPTSQPGALLGLAQGLKQAQDVAPVTKTITKAAPRPSAGGSGGATGGYHFPVGSGHQFSEERTDRGQDFSTNPGGSVNAIGNAIVVRASGNPFPGSGPLLKMLDGPLKGRYIGYGHARRSLVHTGQRVVAGQPVAVAGGVGGGGAGHMELYLALDSSGRIDQNVGGDHFSWTGQKVHDVLHRINPKLVRRQPIRSG